MNKSEKWEKLLLEINQTYKDKHQVISTEIKGLDYILGGGLELGSKVQIVAESSTGKSTIALQMAKNFCQKNLNVKTLFANDMKCDIDWSAWEIASKMDGRFVFVNKPLMGHRIHEESTTTEIIEDNNRSKEDYEIFRRFWITPIAKLLTKLYSNSEKSNKV